MKVRIFRDYEELSRAAADLIIQSVNTQPNPLLCFAGGNTPVRTYRHLIKAAKEGRVDFSHCKFVSLDEWVGLDQTDQGSCKYLLDREIFKPLAIPEESISFFDGKALSLEDECQKVDCFINTNGPIDLMVLGIGINGHLGFNEPGSNIQEQSHVVRLQEITKKVGRKYFNEWKQLSMGITLGLSRILESKAVLLLANGNKKTAIIRQLIISEVTEKIPASILKLHPYSFLLLDQAAAAGAVVDDILSENG